MKNLILLLAVVGMLAVLPPAASADYLSGKTQSAPALFKFETRVKEILNDSRCIGLGSTDPIQLASGMKTFDVCKFIADNGATAYGTVAVVLNGVPYSIGGTTGVSLASLASSTQATGTWRIYVIQMRPGAAVETTGASTGNGAVDTGPVYSVVAGTASSTRASATWPALTSSSYVAVGYCIIKANGTFTPGTSSFDTQTAVLTGPIVGPYSHLYEPLTLNPVNE